jgi:hypothetical protein
LHLPDGPVDVDARNREALLWYAKALDHFDDCFLQSDFEFDIYLLSVDKLRVELLRSFGLKLESNLDGRHSTRNHVAEMGNH